MCGPLLEQHRREPGLDATPGGFVQGLKRKLSRTAGEGYPLKREEVAQLSPYLTEHVKRFGDYVIDLETVPAPLDGEMPELAD